MTLAPQQGDDGRQAPTSPVILVVEITGQPGTERYCATAKVGSRLAAIVTSLAGLGPMTVGTLLALDSQAAMHVLLCLRAAGLVTAACHWQLEFASEPRPTPLETLHGTDHDGRN